MQTISELIIKQALERPKAIFLQFENEEYTFLDLKQQVENYATYFIQVGIKKGHRVGILLRNKPQHVFIYLALTWIGASIVEISIHLKHAGMRLQLEDADLHFLFTEDAHMGYLMSAITELASPPEIIWGDKALEKKILQLSIDTPVEPVIDFDRIQSISYTSGTTGRPKGAMLSERWFQIGAKNAGLLADVRADDVLFLWEPFYHVAGWMTILISLQHGVRIGMVDRFSASRCWEQIRHFNATLLHYLGGLMNILLKQPPSDQDRDNPIRIAWGAAAPKRSWIEFEQRFGVSIREGYGLSEGQNFTHMNIDGPVGSIGLPVEEFDAWIESVDGGKLQAGGVGEIVLRPTDLNVAMSGYFNHPQKTAEVIKDGCIYTGDLGYQDEHGYFYFSGRKKDSLRRRGENVSAWEVERVLNAHPDVEESAVIGVATDIGEQDIKAFVKFVDGIAVSPAELIAWCQQELAYYQVPRYLEIVEDFPRGPTQRIKKTELSVSVNYCWDAEAKQASIKC